MILCPEVKGVMCTYLRQLGPNVNTSGTYEYITPAPQDLVVFIDVLPQVLEKSAGPPWTCDACGSVYQQYCNLTRHKKHPKNCRENVRNGWAWVGKDHKVDVR